ncbi:dihydrodipicolinate synthase family protein [Streptomyces sp. NPDC050164]|uniref:dihydrodipicolinate synthase family protein n=1 Tax=Streptomyces sp. NPDC050164 TaxID=3365605 RepID=UPI00378881CB
MIGGLTVALVTPVTDTGEVSEADTARLVASVRPYADALLPALSTGEGAVLTDRQWRAVVSATVRHADGLPVFAGILRPTTAEVAVRARAAEELGAAAVVATTPYGPGVSQEEMVRHYADLTSATTLPVVVYHESAVSGNTCEAATLLRICALPGIAAVKDSAGDARATRELIAADPGVPVLQGLEHLLLECGPLAGCVVALGNVEPALCAALLSDPSDTHTARLGEARARYGLDRDDWYLALKTELHRRGVLQTARAVFEPPPGERLPAPQTDKEVPR